jgi:putative hydrolase, CocE/NonD family
MRTRELAVRLPDGVGLRTIVYGPEGGARRPTLFSRTPYAGLEAQARPLAEQAARRGYNYVLQFCRGTGGSEGEWVPNVHDRDDGIESLRWLAAQSWCGRIGVHGSSYMAFTGWIIADALPPGALGLFLCHYGTERHLSAYKDGLFRHDILTGWAMANAGRKVTDDFPRDYLRACAYRPHARVDEELWGGRLEWYREWITRTDRSDAYWRSGVWKTLLAMPGKVRVPTCVVAGWFDHHLEGTLLAYEGLAPEAKGESALVVGGWTHDFVPSIPAHPGENASLDIGTTMLDWFDGLRGEGRGPRRGVSAYAIGEDRWLESDSWPLSASGRVTFYLSMAAAGGGRGAGPCHALRETADARRGTLSYDYDPEDPTPSLGGETLFVSEHIRGCRRQSEPGLREDVLTFLSDPIAEALPIRGKAKVVLFVDSDCEDTCFAIKLCEMLPNGEAYNIRSAITTLAYRNGRSERDSYKPGEVVEIELEALPIAWTVGSLSRIRLDVASADFPQYAAHPNYPGVWSLCERTRVARQTLHFGGGLNPRIELPVGGP